MGYVCSAWCADAQERGHLWRLIDADVYRSATFGSFNSKIAVVGKKWFLAYLVASKGYRVGGFFKLVESDDSGRTWRPIYIDDIRCLQPPSMVADSSGRLHLTMQYEGGFARYVRFAPDETGEYRPDVRRQFGRAGTKSALAYDPTRQRLYFSHRESGQMGIAVLDLEGRLVSDKTLVKKRGTYPLKGSAVYEDAHYQSLVVDAAGVVHLLYTRALIFNKESKPEHRYSGVHYMRSPDGGKTWETGGRRLAIPTDLTTPQKVYLPEQEGFGKELWGECIAADARGAHILYWGYDSRSRRHRPHYVCLDARGNESVRGVLPLRSLHTPLISGENSGDVYAFGINDERAAVLLRAQDEGRSWRTVAAMRGPKLRVPYAATAFPRVTRSGYVLAALTDRPRPNKPEGDHRTRVYFFRFDTRKSPGTE